MYVKQKEQCGSHTRHDLIADVARSYHGRVRIEPLDKRLLVVILLPLKDGAGTVELFYED